MKTYAITNVGKKREVNQDYVYAAVKPIGNLSNLFIVADGMGGHNAGDLASKCTVEVLKGIIARSKHSSPRRLMGEGIQTANHDLLELASTDSKLEGMGTTIVVATIVDKVLHIANVGDSRLYIINQDINQITKDHSLVEEMVRLGGIKPEEAKNHPDKNIITRAVGAKEELEVDFYEQRLEIDDIIIMCSDGLSNLVEDRDIFRIVKGARDVVEIGELLIREANNNGGDDNIAVVVIKPSEDEVSIC